MPVRRASEAQLHVDWRTRLRPRRVLGISVGLVLVRGDVEPQEDDVHRGPLQHVRHDDAVQLSAEHLALAALRQPHVRVPAHDVREALGRAGELRRRGDHDEARRRDAFAVLDVVRRQGEEFRGCFLAVVGERASHPLRVDLARPVAELHGHARRQPLELLQQLGVEAPHPRPIRLRRRRRQRVEPAPRNVKSGPRYSVSPP